MIVVVKYEGVEFLVRGDHTKGQKSNDRDVPDDKDTVEVHEIYLKEEEKTDLFFLFEQIDGGIDKIRELCLEAL
jgi:hypothetical protein